MQWSVDATDTKLCAKQPGARICTIGARREKVFHVTGHRQNTTNLYNFNSKFSAALKKIQTQLNLHVNLEICDATDTASSGSYLYQSAF